MNEGIQPGGPAGVGTTDLLWVATRAFLRTLGAYDTLPTAQLAVLRQLTDGGSSSIKELAVKEQVRQQSMAGTVHLMREQGLVSIEPDQANRRWSIVSITTDGAKGLVAAQSEHHNLVLKAASSGLSDEERVVLNQVPDLLMKLSRSLSRADTNRRPGLKSVPLGSASGRH